MWFDPFGENDALTDQWIVSVISFNLVSSIFVCDKHFIMNGCLLQAQ